jgi:HK97 gp10 family phage protein
MSKLVVEIQGFEQLQAKIKDLANDKDKRREVLNVLRQVAKPTVQAAKSNAPIRKRAVHYGRPDKTGKLKKQEAGNLKKSIGTITGRSENPTIYVGARAKGSHDGYYAHFVEKGHRIFNQAKFKITRNAVNGRFESVSKTARARANKKGSVSTGNTRANPFMKKAYDTTQGGVTEDAESKVAAYIQRRIDKLSS